ncbi:helix-turn-helix transcriptional regulator [Streptomyces niveus]|uniref:helix-turn-helix transcriptional regulator n=1 Tax=Streptomyces niveus TaxID=193462 RepID=UPI0036538AF3
MKPRYGRLKRRRKAPSDSQERYALALGAATSTIGRWERGEIAPSDYIRPKLAGLFRVTLCAVSYTASDASG